MFFEGRKTVLPPLSCLDLEMMECVNRATLESKRGGSGLYIRSGVVFLFTPSKQSFKIVYYYMLGRGFFSC